MRTSAPNVIWLTEGTAEGDTSLNAFDNALLVAGIANHFLSRLESYLFLRFWRATDSRFTHVEIGPL